MAPLLPIETLNYYLSKSGFLKFREWFKSIEFLQPIHDDLETLTYIIDNSTWLEDKLRKDTLNKIKLLILKHIEKILNKEPEMYFQEWINSIQEYCFQGGYGYRVQYSGNVPHHWCVRCEHYDKVKNIPSDVALCGVVCDKYFNLSEKPETMYWTG
jgi:hypothetical protein